MESVSQSTYIKDFVSEFPPNNKLVPVPICDSDVHEIVSAATKRVISLSTNKILYKRIIRKIIYAMLTLVQILHLLLVFLKDTQQIQGKSTWKLHSS
jgi:hypothetical protein